MSLIDKSKRRIANTTQPIKIFNTEAEFNTWKATLPSPDDISKFLVIQKYETFGDVTSATRTETTLSGENFNLFSPKVNYFTATSDTPMTVQPKFTNPSGVLSYSIDNGTTWTPITSGASTTSATSVKFRGIMPTLTLFKNLNPNNAWAFTGGTNVRLSGDITTLLAENGNTKEAGGFAFCYMFYNQANLTEANITIPHKMAVEAGEAMFAYCTNLVVPPKIATMEMETGSLYMMFSGCSGLKTTPKLPAKVLTKMCYAEMFSECTSLTTMQEMSAETLAEKCCENMFMSCSSLITLPKSLPAMNLALNCYHLMFNGCSALTTAPELPATVMVPNCYLEMFAHCRALVNAPALPSMTLASYCYGHMFGNCNSLKVAPALPATTLIDNCYNSMFSNNASLVATPILPATTLAISCYHAMFSGCEALTTIPVLLSTPAILPRNCYSNMFSNCTGLTSLKAMSFGNDDCAIAMFDNIPNLFSATQQGVYQVPMTSIFPQNVFSNLGTLAGTIYGKQ